ncbi:MAG: hypothetical protein KC414_09320, partial [Romboutsia sp.]|nr:hypothetical protein [Romboutsia sp.]
ANKIFKATSDDSLIDNLSSYVDASKKMSKVWLNRFKKFGNVYKKYVNKNIDCKVEKNLCLYYSTLKSMKDEDISIYASGLNELLEKENLGLISKLLFKLEAYKNKKIFYENIDFISFFKTYVRKQSLNDPYYYAIQKIHIHYNTQPVEYLIPWDLALHEILEWKNKNIASNKNAILLCNEAKWEECHSELKKDNNVENLMKFYLLTLNYEAASDLYSSLSTEGKENLGYILGLERSPSFDNSIGVLSLVASSKLALDEGNYKKAFSLALQAVQKYPNISYVYTNMMKINLRLKDYMAFDYTLKQMLSNTDSDWANLVSVIIHPSLDERNIRNIYKGAYVSWVSKNEQKDFNGPLGDLNLIMSSLFHRSTENIHPNHRVFGGTQFLYSVYNGKHERIEDGLFSYWLENSRRNTASEVD